MPPITADEARVYFERWAMVRDAEIDALRRTSMATKLRQLESLMASRLAFGPELNREKEVAALRERWNRLRRAPGV